jgi:hypothetical protein
MPVPLASYVESWRPEPVTDEDALPPAPAAALSALLDLPGSAATSGGPLPPLWQWLYFLRWAPAGPGPRRPSARRPFPAAHPRPAAHVRRRALHHQRVLVSR